MRLKQLKRVKSAWFVALFAVICLMVSGNLCFAKTARAYDIRTKIQRWIPDYGKVMYPVKNDKNTKFTRANLNHVNSPKDFEDGQVIGLLETGTPSDKQYVYVWNENGRWNGVAASANGTVNRTISVHVIGNVMPNIGNRSDKSPVKRRRGCIKIEITYDKEEGKLTITISWRK